MNFAKEARTVSQFTFALAVFFVGMMMFASSASADINITEAEVDGGSTVTVDPGESIEITVTVQRDGHNTSDDWKSTSYDIIIDGQPFACVDTPQYTQDGTDTESFDIVAPLNPGTYDVEIKVYRSPNCQHYNGSEDDSETLRSAIVVEESVGSIEFLKSTNSESGSSVEFDFDGGQAFGPFTLFGNNDDSQLFSELSAGTYTVTESSEEGWVLGGVNCDSENAVETETGVTIDLAAGENVVCTFANEVAVYGCMDREALNYNDSANVDDSCIYPVVLDAPDVTLNSVGELSCGVQDITLSGLVAFVNPTTADAFVIEIDDVVVLDDRDIDDENAPDGETFEWSRTIPNVSVGSHTVDVTMYDDEETKEIVRASASTEFTITECPPIEVPTYRVFGYVWDDKDEDGDENGAREENEEPLAGWTVTITNGRDTFTTETNADGLYEFQVPVGTWTIDDGSDSGWEQTVPATGTYTVEVRGYESYSYGDAKQGFFASVMNFLVPQALAADSEEYGPYNFGNDSVGSSSSGSKAKKSTGSKTNDDAGEVLGASTAKPEGGVAGASTSIVPAGAPNTGAGGTSPVVVVLPSLLAVLEGKTSVRKSN